MPKKDKKRERGWKEKLAEKRAKHQRALEAHRIRIEKKLAEKRSQKQLKSIIISVVCLLVIILCVCVAWRYIESPRVGSQEQGNSQQQTSQPSSSMIYIWPNGSVDPATAPIVKVREGYYKFNDNINLPIVVLKDNIVIDGAGYSLTGGGTGGSTKGIDLSYRNNVTVTNLRIEGFDYAIYMSSTSQTTITKSEFVNNYCALWLTNSLQNKITSNNISKNEFYAIWLKNSTHNLIAENTLTSHFNYTIYLTRSNYNIIRSNIISKNHLGIFLYSSSNNTISYNSIAENYKGIHLLNSTQNLITMNDIAKNEIGIGFDESSNNKIYRNNFLNNTIPADVQNSINMWDYGGFGNYWSDYEQKNPDAKKLNDVWDKPYVIDENNEDNYPLTKPAS